jgi:hypothetical protein
LGYILVIYKTKEKAIARLKSKALLGKEKAPYRGL